MRYSVMYAVMSVVMLIAVCGGMAQDAEAWPWSGPGNYDDCIIDAMKGVTSDVAVKAIERACRNKFPELTYKEPPKEPTSSRLPSDAVKNITGSATWNGRLITGKISNNDESWCLKAITIKIVPKEAAKKAELSQSCVMTSLTSRQPIGNSGNSYTDEQFSKWLDQAFPHWCRGIQPSSEGPFTCSGISAPEGAFMFDWYITDVQGYQDPRGRWWYRWW